MSKKLFFLSFLFLWMGSALSERVVLEMSPNFISLARWVERRGDKISEAEKDWILARAETRYAGYVHCKNFNNRIKWRVVFPAALIGSGLMAAAIEPIRKWDKRHKYTQSHFVEHCAEYFTAGFLIDFFALLTWVCIKVGNPIDSDQMQACKHIIQMLEKNNDLM